MAFLALVWPLIASAACPPLPPTNTELSFFEQLAKYAHKDRPLSGDEINKLLRSGAIKITPFAVFPKNGPAPLAVEVRWWFLTDGTENSVELDLNGSGSFIAQPSYLDANSWMQEGKLRHVYELEGIYQATLRVGDGKSQFRTYQQPIEVKSKEEFIAELRSIWTDFTMALRQGDLAAALNCTHASAREKYKIILPEIINAMVPIDEVLGEIRFVQLTPGRAEFEMLRREGNDLVSYMVEFSIDHDGIWRIRFF